MISLEESKKVIKGRMGSWLLKLLSRGMKIKTKKQKSTNKQSKKQQQKLNDWKIQHLPWTTILEMDRWEILIDIFHLSISGIVAHSRYYILHCFYCSVILSNCLLVDSCLFLFPCFLTVVSATKNPF